MPAAIETVEIVDPKQLTNFPRLVIKIAVAETGPDDELSIILAPGIISKCPRDIDFMHEAMTVGDFMAMPECFGHPG